MTLLTEPTRIVLAKGQPVPNDPNFAFNSLLLHGDGTNGSTVITDSSGSPKTVTAVGNAQISTAIADPFGSSTGVIAFDGAGDYLQLPSSTDFVLGTGDFTIEAWLYPLGFAGAPNYNNYGPIFDNRSQDIQVNILFAFFGSSAPALVVNGSARITGTAISTDDWTHIALCRAGGATRMFINGSQAGSTYTDSNNYTGSAFKIAANRSADGFFNGYIDDYRITKGVARYTATFTPPTAPFPDF
jgi:hypothetical protein